LVHSVVGARAIVDGHGQAISVGDASTVRL